MIPDPPNTQLVPQPAAETVSVKETPEGQVVAGVVVSPTQVRRPWRSTARTIFQALVSLAAIAPLIKAGVEESTGYDLDGIPFIIVVLAGAAAVTRVMAIPGVETWLRRFLPFLAAAPKPTLGELT